MEGLLKWSPVAKKCWKRGIVTLKIKLLLTKRVTYFFYKGTYKNHGVTVFPVDPAAPLSMPPICSSYSDGYNSDFSAKSFCTENLFRGFKSMYLKESRRRTQIFSKNKIMIISIFAINKHVITGFQSQ